MYVFDVKVDNSVRPQKDIFLIEELETFTNGKETFVHLIETNCCLLIN